MAQSQVITYSPRQQLSSRDLDLLKFGCYGKFSGNILPAKFYNIHRKFILVLKILRQWFKYLRQKTTGDGG